MEVQVCISLILNLYALEIDSLCLENRVFMPWMALLYALEIWILWLGNGNCMPENSRSLNLGVGTSCLGARILVPCNSAPCALAIAFLCLDTWFHKPRGVSFIPIPLKPEAQALGNQILPPNPHPLYIIDIMTGRIHNTYVELLFSSVSC